MLRIPYVIDNQNHRMADVLSGILAPHRGKSLDVATAYFNLEGFKLLQEGLQDLGSFRLLLGDEPQDGESIGLRPRAASRLTGELNAAPFTEDTLRSVEELIAFLRREMVSVRAYQQGFLHAKSYIFYGDLPVGGEDRFQPVAAIVGSSNFTGPGLTTNKELNLSHKTVLTEDEMTLAVPNQSNGQVDVALRRELMSGVGAQAIAGAIVSQEELGQVGFDWGPFYDADVILIDESHNFRNRTTQRYENIERIISANGRRGKDGGRKKLILLTATPVNNNIFDLYNQLVLITGGDRSYFSGAGIGGLYRFFLNARRNVADHETGVALFNLLEEVVIRRTRAFVRETYPEAMIRGERIRWPDRRLKTVRYDLESTYSGIYDRVVDSVEGLRLAPYQLETYKKAGVKRDEFEQGREEALAGIFRSRYLKRFESSVDAFRITVRRALEFTKTFESYLLDGKLLDSTSFHKSMRYLSSEDEDDSTPVSRAGEMDVSQEAHEVIETLEALDTSQYDLRRLHESLQHDVESLTELWQLVCDITPDQDAKLDTLKQLLSEDLKGEKVIVFTYYRDTARYLYRELGADEGAQFRMQAGEPAIRRMDGGASPSERSRLIQAFAPQSNNRPDLVGSGNEVDILISTDVLAEGQNLQDCGILVNYDLHWNPTRMVQRAGRIDRIGSKHERLWVHNMFPEEGLERLLRLVESLSRKITDIDRTGFLDASVLGEAVHPRNFNTLRRIMDEDGAVIEEQEQFAELASNEFLLQHLLSELNTGARGMLEELPDGIHSGLVRDGEKGMFFYFTAPGDEGEGRRHFWRYYDIGRDRVLDNRFLIANMISCSPDTPRVVGDCDVFAIQDRVIDNILSSVREQQAVEAAPTILAPLQQTVITLLRGYLNSPAVNHADARDAMKRLRSPMTHTAIRELRRTFEQFQTDQNIEPVVSHVQSIEAVDHIAGSAAFDSRSELSRKDLHLVCFDYVWS